MWDTIKCTNIRTIKTTHHIQEKPNMIYSLFLIRNHDCYKAVEIGSKERTSWVNHSLPPKQRIKQNRILKNAKSEH